MHRGLPCVEPVLGAQAKPEAQGFATTRAALACAATTSLPVSPPAVRPPTDRCLQFYTLLHAGCGPLVPLGAGIPNVDTMSTTKRTGLHLARDIEAKL